VRGARKHKCAISATIPADRESLLKTESIVLEETVKASAEDKVIGMLKNGGTVAASASRSCVACGSDESRPLFRELVTCCQCGMVYFPNWLTREELARLYGPEYFHGAEYFGYLADRGAHEANFRRRVRELARWVPAGGRVFEVGCAYGLFLNLARRRWQVRGCDIAQEACRHARENLGLDVTCADFAELPLSAGEVDAFCMWDTIEHLDDPGRYLARMAELLRPGGILAITTADIGSRLARRQGERWRQIHPPTHIWYFSRATLERTLSRFGFEPVWSRYIGVSRSVGQIVYSLTSLGRPRASWMHRWCMKSGLGRINLWSNTFDLLMMVARRRESPGVATCAQASGGSDQPMRSATK